MAKKKLSITKKQNIAGWTFLTPAVILICVMSFYPMVRALFLSFQSGTGAKLTFAGLYNYKRLLSDKVLLLEIKVT